MTAQAGFAKAPWQLTEAREAITSEAALGHGFCNELALTGSEFQTYEPRDSAAWDAAYARYQELLAP